MNQSNACIEIVGPWLLNKGDDLMLHAVKERLESRHLLAASSDLGRENGAGPGALHRIRWPPTARNYLEAARTHSFRRLTRLAKRSAALTLLPASVIRRRGYVSGRSVSALLDCSGFAYGDQWSTRRPQSRAEEYARRKRIGCRLVMLPQALGPFDEPHVRDAVRTLLQSFDLIFARDDASYRNVLDLGLDPARVGAAPDVTHLVEPPPPEDANIWASRVCVVPNARMLDKTSREVSRMYVKFILTSIRQIRKSDLEPCLVLHERNDAALFDEIRSMLDFEIMVIDEDGFTTKGILGSAHAVVGSRYHALVGALSQGTPTIGTSWSHKYEQLFREYECPHCLVSPDRDPAEVRSTIRSFLEPGNRDALRRTLLRNTEKQKRSVNRMWDRVEAVLEQGADPVNSPGTG